jgi:mannose-6-phosphate isomerase-like protein (cupin superfamily)
MRFLFAIVVFLTATPVIGAVAQTQPANTVRTLLASGRLASVVDTPLYFRLFRVRLPASEQTTYTGPNAVLYELSSALTTSIDGTVQSVSEGTGSFIPAGAPTTFRARTDPASFLLFVLSPAADLEKLPLGAPTVVDDLYRTPGPVPDLKAGPYEFSLTRVALPPAMPANPTHYRSGAALYYILAGTGAFTAGDKTEPRSAGMPHFEPSSLVHQWANPGETPLVLIQANISQEGIPAVLPGTPPTGTK